MKIERVLFACTEDDGCLNPYSTGMKIEPTEFVVKDSSESLNPYSTGMKIEQYTYSDGNVDDMS